MNVSVRLDVFLDEDGELDHPGDKWVTVRWFGDPATDEYAWRDFYDGLGRFRQKGTWSRTRKCFCVARACLPELLRWISECGNQAFWQEPPREIPFMEIEAEDARDEILLNLADAAWARLATDTHAGATA